MPEKVPSPTQPPLTFQWVEPVRSGRRLGFWLFVVMIGLAAFFYLFQVVYPQTQRFTPVPQHVVVLNPSDPAATAILSRVQDRDYLLLPSDNDPAGTSSLQDQAPVFHPSFEGHQLRVQDLPYKAFTVPPARLLNVDKPVLPPLDLSELKPEPGAKAADDGKPVTPARLTVSFVGDLSKRPLIAPPDLSDVPLAYPESCRFQMGVDAAGQVEFLLPVSTSDKPEVPPQMAAQLLKRLQALRFQPLPLPGKNNGNGKDSAPGPTPSPTSTPTTGKGAPAVPKELAAPTWGTVILSWTEPDAP